jgi:Putative death-receptor fusion protein (DUF2428)
VLHGDVVCYGLLTIMPRYIFDRPEFFTTLSSMGEDVQARWCILEDNIVDILTQIWDTVYDVLCNDAPEGHVPDDMEDAISLDTKDILSYCWRALKEARFVAIIQANSYCHPLTSIAH